jgi:putative GTP pyrophosphokinase
MISKTQIDKLGDRLRKDTVGEEDLRTLDEYRRSFSGAYDFVVGTIRGELEVEPTGRPAKSTPSISEKLQRESIRLTQIQDIAGCRVIVADIGEQERVVRAIQRLFAQSQIVDRRDQPSHGYRAVHIIVHRQKRWVEIQVRTLLQHVWAELSEKLADLIHPEIKYGKGDEFIVAAILGSSQSLATHEEGELQVAVLEQEVSDMLSVNDVSESNKEKLLRLRKEIAEIRHRQGETREKMLQILGDVIQTVSITGDDNVISD